MTVEPHGVENLLTIADNGLGFDPQGRDDDAHFGLVIMEERAALLGGELTVDSAPGQCTRIVARWPAPIRNHGR